MSAIVSLRVHSEILVSQPLAGLRVLILEDEFLIAMDVEQLCRDHGAADVIILRRLEDYQPPVDGGRLRRRRSST